MHMQGKPRTMQADPHYLDVVREVRDFLVERALIAEGAGIARDRIAIDPGFGFGKTQAHNLVLLRSLRLFAQTGYPVLAGLSRKATIGEITGRSVEDRMAGSVAAALMAVAHGAAIVRVHDVRETADALKVWLAVENERQTEEVTCRRKYFGTDGIRGRVGEPPITPDLVMKLGWAVGRTLASAETARRGDRPGVLIGKDTRISGYMLEAALEAGLSAAGVDVHLCGPLPTPGIAYLTRALRLSAGIVISASHNPFDDNGIKFFSAAGAKLPDDVEAAIEREHGRAARVRRVGRPRQGVARRRRGGPLRRVLQEHVPVGARPARLADRRRLRARRRLSRRPARVPRTGRRGDLRSAPSPTASTSMPARAPRIRSSSPSRCARTAPTSGSRSTATATAS